MTLLFLTPLYASIGIPLAQIKSNQKIKIMKAFVKKIAFIGCLTVTITPLHVSAKKQMSHATYRSTVKPKHKYVYYPKQNMYYVPSRHVYYVWRHDHWQPFSSVPSMYAHVNFEAIPYVNLYLTTEHPYYYNVEHRKQYRAYIFASVASTPAVIYKEKKYKPIPKSKPRVRAEIVVNFSPVVVESRPVFVEHHHHGHGHGHYKGRGRGHGKH